MDTNTDQFNQLIQEKLENLQLEQQKMQEAINKIEQDVDYIRKQI